MRRPGEFLTFTCLAAALGAGLIASRTAAADGDAEVPAIRAAAKAYVSALRRGDATALTAMWTADGDYVDAAGHTYGVQELIAQIAPTQEPAAGPESINLPESKVRFIAPTVAIEEGVIGSASGGESAEPAGRFSAVWVKREGKWLLASLRESAAAPQPGRAELRPLQWLVGEWAGGDGDAAALMSWRWSDSGQYLVGEYLVYGQDGEVAGGSQRLGWDPSAKQIKSWTFNSQGGAGQGRWRQDGNRWIADFAHLTADGKASKSSATYTRDAEGRLHWDVKCDWETPEAKDAEAMPARRFEFRRAH